MLIKHLYEVFIVSCHHIIDESVNILLAITKLFGKTPSLPHESKGIASWASEIDDDFSRDGLFSNHDMVLLVLFANPDDLNLRELDPVLGKSEKWRVSVEGDCSGCDLINIGGL